MGGGAGGPAMGASTMRTAMTSSSVAAATSAATRESGRGQEHDGEGGKADPYFAMFHERNFFRSASGRALARLKLGVSLCYNDAVFGVVS